MEEQLSTKCRKAYSEMGKKANLQLKGARGIVFNKHIAFHWCVLIIPSSNDTHIWIVYGKTESIKFNFSRHVTFYCKTHELNFHEMKM